MTAFRRNDDTFGVSRPERASREQSLDRVRFVGQTGARSRRGVLALGLAAAGLAIGRPTAAAPVLRIGRKMDIEQDILAAMTEVLLRDEGLDVVLLQPMTTSMVRAAQERGEIDVYWEYTGTSLAVFYRRRPPFGTVDTYAEIAGLDAQQGLIWLAPTRVDNPWTLAMRRPEAEALEIVTISDLVRELQEGWDLSIALSDEFYARADGLKPLQTTYGFTWPRELIRRVGAVSASKLLIDGEIDVAVTGVTDGLIATDRIVRLVDDRSFFPPYRLAPVVTETALGKAPMLRRRLEALTARLDTEQMRQMNRAVALGGQPAKAVARRYLMQNGLLKADG